VDLLLLWLMLLVLLVLFCCFFVACASSVRRSCFESVYHPLSVLFSARWASSVTQWLRPVLFFPLVQLFRCSFPPLGRGARPVCTMSLFETRLSGCLCQTKTDECTCSCCWRTERCLTCTPTHCDNRAPPQPFACDPQPLEDVCRLVHINKCANDALRVCSNGSRKVSLQMNVKGQVPEGRPQPRLWVSALRCRPITMPTQTNTYFHNSTPSATFLALERRRPHRGWNSRNPFGLRPQSCGNACVIRVCKVASRLKSFSAMGTSSPMAPSRVPNHTPKRGRFSAAGRRKATLFVTTAPRWKSATGFSVVPDSGAYLSSPRTTTDPQEDRNRQMNGDHSSDTGEAMA